MRPAVLFLLFCACPAAALAQTDTATLNVTIGGLAHLSFSSNTVSFPDADPDALPLVPAAGGPITIIAKVRSPEGAVVMLSLQATDDLRSGITTIPAANISWTTSGAGFVNGTVVANTLQTVAAWPGSGVHAGRQMFFFRNLWTHPIGTFTLTLVYTVTAA